jgi:hypothetical protein
MQSCLVICGREAARNNIFWCWRESLVAFCANIGDFNIDANERASYINPEVRVEGSEEDLFILRLKLNQFEYSKFYSFRATAIKVKIINE